MAVQENDPLSIALHRVDEANELLDGVLAALGELFLAELVQLAGAIVIADELGLALDFLERHDSPHSPAVDHSVELLVASWPCKPDAEGYKVPPLVMASPSLLNLDGAVRDIAVQQCLLLLFDALVRHANGPHEALHGQVPAGCFGLLNEPQEEQQAPEPIGTSAHKIAPGVFLDQDGGSVSR